VGADGGTGWELTLRVLDASGKPVRTVTLRWAGTPSAAVALGALAGQAWAAHRAGHRVALVDCPAGLGELLEATGLSSLVDSRQPGPQAAVTTAGRSKAANSEVSR
jgi:hypothetical protein